MVQTILVLWAGNFMVFAPRCSLMIFYQDPETMLSNNRSASSLRHNSVPGVMTAAVPAATPKRTDSLSGLPRARLKTIPATMLSPAPTLLIMGTVGGRMCSAKSSETTRAPAAPKGDHQHLAPAAFDHLPGLGLDLRFLFDLLADQFPEFTDIGLD